MLDEVNKTEIPTLQDEEGNEEDKAVQGPQTLKGRLTSLLPIDPTKHRRDLNRARGHGGYDKKTGTPPFFVVSPVPELGEFREKMEWQQHPFDKAHAEEKAFWKESEDNYAPQDATMVFGAGRLRRESKTQAVHNPYGWLGAKGAEVPVTTADSQDTRTGGLVSGYRNGAAASTRTSLEAGSKLCQLVDFSKALCVVTLLRKWTRTLILRICLRSTATIAAQFLSRLPPGPSSRGSCRRSRRTLPRRPSRSASGPSSGTKSSTWVWTTTTTTEM